MAIENQKQIILIAFAVVAGVGATILTSNYVTKSIEQKTQELHDQYQGQQKQVSEDVRQRSDAQMASVRQELENMRQAQQQVIQQAMAARTKQEGSQNSNQTNKAGTLLSAKTPEGKRAVTVQIDSLNAVGGLLSAGDFVDVIARLDVPEESTEKKKQVTAMIFQNLQVLAINTNLDEPGQYGIQQGSASLKITFAVDPQEAGLLSFANNNGKLELALRAVNESDKQTVKTSTWKTLADYVLENQGNSFDVPEEIEIKKADSSSGNGKPPIQIFRGGKEL